VLFRSGRESGFQETWIKREAELQDALGVREAQWLQEQRETFARQRREWEEGRDREIAQRRRDMEMAMQQREKVMEETLRARQKEIENLLVQKEKDLILTYDDQLFKARAEADATCRAREEALEIKYLELEKRLVTESVSRENAFAVQKRDLVDREIAGLRSDFAAKQGELERRAQAAEKAAAERQAALEAEFERRKEQLTAAITSERDSLHAAFEKRNQQLEESYQERFQQLEAKKSRVASGALQKEDELAANFQRLERDLRNELNRAKIQHAAMHDEKLRKLAEERAAMQKDYENKLRELDQRRHKEGL
jgi:hypothetical protein